VADVVGRGVITQVVTNEPLLDVKLADRGQGGLQITIPEGMRAIAVRVDEVIGVAGFVTPGTRVDVFLTVDQENVSTQERSVTKLIMQNVQALASNQQAQRDPEGNPVLATVITVLVTPDDAEKLILAGSRGRIQMALRNLVDVKDVTTDGARISELLTGVSGGRTGGGNRAAAPAPQQPAGTTVEVIKGGQRALIRF
jgi:pilus assembly protein CpaB